MLCVDEVEVINSVCPNIFFVQFSQVDHIFLAEQSTGVNFLDRLREFLQIIPVDANFFQQLLLVFQFCEIHSDIFLNDTCKLILFIIVFLLCVG